MSLDYFGTSISNAAEATKALNAAADGNRGEVLIKKLPEIMGKSDLRYAVKDRHIRAMFAAVADDRMELQQAILVTLPYAKFWGLISDEHMETVANKLVTDDNVETLAGITHTLRSDTRLNRVMAPFVTQMARRIKTLTDDKRRSTKYDILERAVQGSSILEEALRTADRPSTTYGASLANSGQVSRGPRH